LGFITKGSGTLSFLENAKNKNWAKLDFTTNYAFKIFRDTKINVNDTLSSVV